MTLISKTPDQRRVQEMRKAAAVVVVALAAGMAVALIQSGNNSQTATATSSEPTAKQFRAQIKSERIKNAHLRGRLDRMRKAETRFTPTDTRIAAEVVGALTGWPVKKALAVAECESNHEPYARNTISIGNSNASGSWQVLYPSTWFSTHVGRSMGSYQFNPYVNAWVAYEVFKRQGRTFREWADYCQYRE